MKKKKAIIWDWNGTLLDDIELCIQTMNSLLEERQLEILDKKGYRKIFTFPVRKYYEKAGFDFTKEPFEQPAMQFINLYYRNVDTANIFPEAKEVLQYFKGKGYHQSILSAMEEKNLLLSLEEKGLIHFFEKIAGITDHYAHSKVEIGKELFKRLPFHKDEVLLIGDTLHDLEVAEELKIDCILIANGHQSKERLLNNKAIVVNSLRDIISLI